MSKPDRRGNNKDRRQRKLFLIEKFGHGKTVPCHWCGKRLTYKTLTVDRLIPGHAGGRYTRDNIVPACFKCNRDRGTQTLRRAKKGKRWNLDKEFAQMFPITKGDL